MRKATFLLILLAGLTLPAVTSIAQSPYPPSSPTPGPGIPACRTENADQNPDTRFARGERFFVLGSGLGRLGVDILLNGQTNIGSGRANSNGTFTIAARIPSNAPAGAATIEARGIAGRVATCKITIAGRGLPRTGTDAAVLSAWGVSFLAAGTMLVLWAARRRQLAPAGSTITLPPMPLEPVVHPAEAARYTWTEADVYWSREWRDRT